MINYIITGIVSIVVIIWATMFVVNKSTYRCGTNDDLEYKCPVCKEPLPDNATKEVGTFYCYECGTKLRKVE